MPLVKYKKGKVNDVAKKVIGQIGKKKAGAGFVGGELLGKQYLTQQAQDLGALKGLTTTARSKILSAMAKGQTPEKLKALRAMIKINPAILKAMGGMIMPKSILERGMYKGKKGKSA